MEIEINKNYDVNRLRRWLDYELSTSVLLLLSWFWGISIWLMTIAAILFTPFMLKILFQERRYGWIIFFLISVIIPTIGILFLEIDSTYKIVFKLIPLAFFYFYCFLLRLVIRDWGK